MNPLEHLSVSGVGETNGFITAETKMSRPAVEVADILRAQGNRFLDKYRNSFEFQQMKAFRAIQSCRTAALGGHVDACPGVAIRPSIIIRVETGTVRSVKHRRANTGSLHRKQGC